MRLPPSTFSQLLVHVSWFDAVEQSGTDACGYEIHRQLIPDSLNNCHHAQIPLIVDKLS